jgi:hypothetical protein
MAGFRVQKCTFSGISSVNPLWKNISVCCNSALYKRGAQLKRVLHNLMLLGTALPSTYNFACGFALPFSKAACKQARNLRHFNGRKENARTTRAGAARSYPI